MNSAQITIMGAKKKQFLDTIVDIDFFEIEGSDRDYLFFDNETSYVINKVALDKKIYAFEYSNDPNDYFTKNFKNIASLIAQVKPEFEFKSHLIEYLVERYTYGTVSFELINPYMWDIGKINVFDFVENKYHLNDLVKFLMLHKKMISLEDVKGYFDNLFSVLKNEKANVLFGQEIDKLSSDPNVILELEEKFYDQAPNVLKNLRITLTAHYLLNNLMSAPRFELGTSWS